MPKPRKAIQDQETRDGGQLADRLSPVTENYLLSLYQLWEDSEVPTITQLTDNLRQLPPTEGLGTSVPSVAGMIRRMQKQGLRCCTLLLAAKKSGAQGLLSACRAVSLYRRCALPKMRAA